ncbi:CHAT domain-containing protein [Rhizorhabdus histidinilytica]
MPGEIGGLREPGLAFTPPETGSPEDDGLLAASEVTGMHLSADWVILSACNTATADGTPAPTACRASAAPSSMPGRGRCSPAAGGWPTTRRRR